VFKTEPVKSIISPLYISFKALLIAVKQFNKLLITFPSIIIIILYSRLIIVEIRLDFSLRIKAVFKLKVKAFNKDTDFNSFFKAVSFYRAGHNKRRYKRGISYKNLYN
jgi:hypothetical protein